MSFTQITWADLAYYSLFAPMVELHGEAIIQKSPRLKSHIDRVGNVPQIKKYVENRPKTTL